MKVFSCWRRTGSAGVRLSHRKWKAVDELDEQGRDLVELRYARGLTMEEIGTIYVVSKAAVSKQLKKLREQLRGSVK